MDRQFLNLPPELRSYHFWYNLMALPFVRGIYLFGSRARGEAQTRSDIDIAIDCPQASEQDWQRVLDVVEHADTLLSIDLVRYDVLPDSLFKIKIDENKWVVYEN
jgi:uncharacterized protein